MPWFNVEKGILRLRDVTVGLSFKIYLSHRKGPEEILLTNTIAKILHLNFYDLSSCRPDFIMGMEVTKWRRLNAMGVIGSQHDSGQVAVPIAK